MMGHLLHVLGGKRRYGVQRGVVGSFAMGCFRTGASSAFFFFFGGGFVLSCGAPLDLFIKCMPVRVIQPILYRNQTTLQHGLIG